MVAQGNANNRSATGAQAPPKGGPPGAANSTSVDTPLPGQVQSAKAASTSAAYQGTPRTVSQHSTEVLHQRGRMPLCPAKLAIGGFAFAVALGYFTLYVKKNPEASATDVAKVATGTATPEKTRHSRS